MGTLLSQKLDKDYVAIATSFAEGRFRAAGTAPYRGIMEFAIPPPPRGSLEGTLMQLAGDVVAIGFNAFRADSETARWLHYRLRMRAIGAGYTEKRRDAMSSIWPAKLFDALFVIRRGSPSLYEGLVVRPAEPLPTPTNLDFETIENGRPVGWAQTGLGLFAGYRVSSDSREHVDGQASAVLARVEPQRMPGYAGLYQSITAAPFQGRRVRVRAAMRVGRPAANGAARLYLQSEDRRGDVISYRATGPISSTSWQVAEIDIDVGPQCASLTYGLAVSGDAPAWIDTVSIEPVTTTSP
jgi:hypothetical protein